ncbi:hypothetical protein E4U17_004923 [Claviceps sp. LM77 group G4]|nr:hypothetical protein E4U17_004923 [Claviceps sp. LM77 group G4]
MLVNSHSTTPRFITLFPTRSDASTDTAIPKPRAKLSPMGEVGMYDGTEPAQRWLMRLEVLFAGANDEEAVDPKRDKPTNPKLPQGETEVLESYYSRCQSLVVRSGGRDKPLDPLDTLSQAEGYILRDFIFKFVHGLYDKNLMQEAISHSALAVDGLRQAMDVVRRAAGTLSAKVTSAKLSVRDTRTALMEKLITSHLGCSADEALSRAYQFPPGFMETHQLLSFRIVREAIKPQLPSNFKWSQYNRIAEWFQFIRTR